MRTLVRLGCRVLLISVLVCVCSGLESSLALASTVITVINSADSGSGSLRQAISDGNTDSPPVTINFAVPPFNGTVQTIALQSNLPPITSRFAINGFTQSGSSPGANPGALTNNPVVLIALDGSAIGGSGTGLAFAVAGSVQGLIVQNFGSVGLFVAGGVTVTENVVSNALTGIVISGTTNTCTGDFLIGNSLAISVPGSSNTFVVDQVANNTGNGMEISGTNNNFVTSIVSGNTGDGVVISGDGNLLSNLTVTANSGGATITGGSNSLVSSTISFNNQVGVVVSGTGSNSLSNDTVSANGADGVILGDGADTLVGSTISSNTGDGVLVSSAANTVGGPSSGAGNFISANTGNGIDIASTFSTNSPAPPSDANVVQGNFIGTDASGTNDLGNNESGVRIDGTLAEASTNVIGGELSGQANTIAFNGSNGVIVLSNAVDNAIFGNSIFSNTVLGITLTNGANNSPVVPLLTSAICSNAGLLVQGSVTNSEVSTNLLIEFFANVACDPSGFGQGQTFLGSASVTTDLSGGATFSAAFTNFDLVGEFVTATASDNSSNTSQFSQCILVTDTQPPTISQCAPSQTASADTNCEAVVPDFTGTVVASDMCSPSSDLVITQSPTNGTIVTTGTNTVTITVTDQAGNATNCTTSFIVVDTTPPVITCQSDITNTVSSSESSAVVTFPTPTATDNCSTATVTCVPASGSIFPLGTTPVVCTAADAAGNTASCTFNVTVTGPQQVVIDVEPGICPNILNTTEGGVIQVAVVGSQSLNVSNIETGSLILNGVSVNTNFFQIEDVSAPFVYTEGCPKKKKDGIPDLVVEFNVNDLITNLNPVKNGQERVLTLTGTLDIYGTTITTNGTTYTTNTNVKVGTTTFEGQDRIKISTKKSQIPKGLKNPF